jgi:poly(3-hydroxybutyrate) depolymerase
MINVQNFQLDVSVPAIKRLRLVNGDTANRFVITVTNNKAPVTLDTSLHKVIAVFKRADGQVYTQDANTGVSFTTSGVVTVDVRSASFRTGTNTICLQIYKREDSSATVYPLLLTTQEQQFNARSAAIPESGAPISPSQFPMLERYVLAAKSYANGNTGTRDGENTDNAMYYKDLAEQAVQGGIVDPTIDAWLDDHSSHIDGVITDEVDDWLDDHPEATTTVEDGAVTLAKLADSVKEHFALADDVDELKSALNVLTENTDFTGGVDYKVILSIDTGKWYRSSNYTTIFYPVPSGATNISVTANNSKTAVIALLKTDSHANNTYPDYATGQSRIGIPAGETRTLDVPSDCNYVAVLKTASEDNHYPASIIVSKYAETSKSIELLNSAVFGEPLDTFPLEFENGTYKSFDIGATLERTTNGAYDDLVKVVKTTVFNAPCDVVLTAKTGYRFNVFNSVNGIITATSGRITDSYVLQKGNQYGVILASVTDNTDISAVPVSDIVTINYISAIDELTQSKSIFVPVFPGGINRLTGASDMAYDAFWNLRTSALVKVVGKTVISIESDDVQDVSYFNIYEYSEQTKDNITYIQAVRELNFNNGVYNYYPSASTKYIRICLALQENNTKTFLPLTFTSKQGLCLCKNPNITDGSKIPLSYIVDGTTYTCGQLLLPPNYTIDRKPCPLVVIFHGTSSMRKWTQEIGTNSIASTKYLLDYLTNEGFAVFDCYCFTSKYYSTSNQNQDAPLPLFLQAYSEGVKFVCSQFNVDINNVFAFAMSAGGNLGNMAMHSCGDIKYRALAMLCPTTGFAHLLFREYFLYPAMRSIIVRYLHLENEAGADTFISTTHGLDNETVKNFVNSHKDAFAGIICSAIGVHGATFDEQFNWMITGTKVLPEWMSELGIPSIPSAWTTSPATGIPSFVNHPELTAYSNVPIKYWQSFDDANVSGHANYTIYTWLKNGGTLAQWRTLPDGTGGHHAVDTDPNALKSSGTTRLGIAYTDIATTYVEMADFFYQFMAQ